jgi:hypothetical protein
MSKLNWRASLRIMELAEFGAHSVLGVLVLGHLAEENEARPLQGLDDPGGVDDAVEWCVQVHHGDIRGILLWERSILLLWKKAFGRWAHGELPPSSSPRAITSTMTPRSLLSLQLKPPSLRGSKMLVTSSGKGLAI